MIMSEITKYMVTGLGIDLANNSIIAGYAEVTDCAQPICMWSDVEPIIQRNADLEAEIKRLREQEPVGIITDRIIDRGIEWESNFYRYVVIAGIDDCNLYAEPKPAQEIPAEIVGWANSWQEDDSDMPSYLTGCNDMKHFVRSQLEKMNGEPCK
jgi:hypothetical protein